MPNQRSERRLAFDVYLSRECVSDHRKAAALPDR